MLGGFHLFQHSLSGTLLPPRAPPLSCPSLPAAVTITLSRVLAALHRAIPFAIPSLPEPFVPEVKFAYQEGRSRVAKYDVAIIGSGPGGYVAAIRAGELGLKTIVVEKDPFLGGTCLHVGFIPTKVLLHHADVYDHFKNAAELGFEIPGVKVNWTNILARKSKIVTKHAKGVEFLFKKNKEEWVQGWGKYSGPGKVSVEKDAKTSTIEAG